MKKFRGKLTRMKTFSMHLCREIIS